MIARLALCTGWLCIAASTAAADPSFIESPLPPDSAAPAPSPPPSSPSAGDAEIERAAREVREKLELKELEKRGSQSEIDAYRARERRALEIEKTKSAPRSDAERVRADIDQARERIELERRVDRAEEQKPKPPPVVPGPDGR